MTETRVQAFVKFFSEEAHADQFLSGVLYMRKLKYFQNLEAADIQDGRPDPNEGIIAWHQPDRVRIVIEVPGLGKVEIGPNDLAGPVSIARDVFSEIHVFCMTAISVPNPSTFKGSYEEARAQLQEAIKLDPRCLNFGPYAVIMWPGPFVRQLRQALEKCGYWYKAERVKYYDHNDFHGSFSDKEAPFRKQTDFQYQQEYRVCIMTNSEGDDSFTLDIGKLGDFAIKMRSVEIGERFKVDLSPPDAKQSD